MKNKKRLFLTAVLSLAVLLSACSTDITGTISGTDTTTIDPTQDTQIRTEGNTEIMPETVLQIGDSFEYYPWRASGHLLGTVTGIRLVTDETNCPPIEDFASESLLAYTTGEIEKAYQSGQWFTEGGAFDQGCRILLVDLELTNVDAEGFPYDGTGDVFNSGWFEDPYAFYVPGVLEMVDLTVVYSDPEGDSFQGTNGVMYFSHFGQYSQNSTNTDEVWAVQILPGQTVSFTLGYPIDSTDGITKDFSELMFYVGADNNAETGTFIDLGLGDD